MSTPKTVNVIKVRATFEMEVDVSELSEEFVKVDEFALEALEREVDTLSSQDFSYEIVGRELAV